MQNCKVLFNGQEVTVTNATINYKPLSFEGLELTVRGILRGDWQYNERKNMSTIKTVPTNLNKVLNEDQKTFYKLGWIDINLALTTTGEKALLNLLFEVNESALGKAGIEEIAKREEEKSKLCDDCGGDC